MSLVGGRKSKDADSVGARRIAALGNPRRMAWTGLWLALLALVLMSLSRSLGLALGVLFAVAALVVAWRGITNSRRARGHPSGLAKGLATGTLVFGSLVLVMGVSNLIVVVEARHTTTPASSSLTPAPTANVSGGVYRNAKMGLAVDIPQTLSVDDSTSSALMTQLKKALPSAGKGGVNARIGGLVAIYPKYWTGSDEPAGFALMWREPSSRTLFAGLNTARGLRKAAAYIQSTGRSTAGPGVTAVAAPSATYRRSKKQSE